MARKIKVKMEDGQEAQCEIIERLGFSHDIGAFTFWVKHEEKEFMAVKLFGSTYRKWTAADRTRPMLEYALSQKKRKELGDL